MRNEIIYKGLKLSTTKSRYFKVQEGKVNSLVDDNNSVLTLSYIPGSTIKSISTSLGIPMVGDGSRKLESTNGAIKFSRHTTITLNGLVLEKLTYDPHTINIIIVDDSESRVVQTYDHTIFVISKDDYKNPKFSEFLLYSGNLLYLKPVGPRIQGYIFYNFPKLIIGSSSTEVESNNDTFYTLRRRYNDYLIREIDYQDQFIIELRRILDEYGLELVRLNKETTLSKTSYITYQVNQTPTTVSHPKRGDIERNIITCKQPIEFVFHTTDMVLYHDFKNKYNDVFLLSNFVEFKTTDRYGDRWTAAVRWSQITEDFNHVYQQDDNANFSLQCQFRCELYYYEVLDTRYEFLKEITYILDAEDNNKSISAEETKKI